MSGCGTHGGQLWYRHFPADFLDGVKALSAEQRGCYITVLDLIYQFGGKIADKAQWIAGQCNISVKRWNTIRRGLIEGGKLIAREGLLTNPRATEEIAESAAKSEVRAQAGRKGGKRPKSSKNVHVLNDNNDLTEAELPEWVDEAPPDYPADYVPDYEPEESAEIVSYQELKESRISRSSRIEISPSTHSVPARDDWKPPGDRRHPANAPSLPVADLRVTFDEKGRPEVNGSRLDVVVRDVTQAAEAQDGIYPILNCTALIDLLCDGYDPDDDICPIVKKIAARGMRGKPMSYYARAIRNERRPSWKPLGTWGSSKLTKEALA